VFFCSHLAGSFEASIDGRLGDDELENAAIEAAAEASIAAWGGEQRAQQAMGTWLGLTR